MSTKMVPPPVPLLSSSSENENETETNTNSNSNKKQKTVEQALQSRFSCRKFNPSKPVPIKLIKQLLNEAARSPSGGNLQPWNVYVVWGDMKKRLSAVVKDKFVNQWMWQWLVRAEQKKKKQKERNNGKSKSLWQNYNLPANWNSHNDKQLHQQLFDKPEYDFYPPDSILPQVYKDRKKKVGYTLYQQWLGLDREKMQIKVWWNSGPKTVSKQELQLLQLQEMAKNFDFYDAPVGLIITIDEIFPGKPQFSDLGMYLQSFMLLCDQYGLNTISMEIWASHGDTVREVLGIPNNAKGEGDHRGKETIFCGVAVGYQDAGAAVNQFRTERAGVSEFCKFFVEGYDGGGGDGGDRKIDTGSGGGGPGLNLSQSQHQQAKL